MERLFCLFLPVLQNINEFGKQSPCWKNNYYNAAHKHSYLFSQMQSCKIFALIKTDYLEKAYLHSRYAGKQTKATKINLGDRRKGIYLHSNFGIMESSSNIFFQKAIKLIFLHQMCMNLSRILSVFQIWGLLRIQFVLKRKSIWLSKDKPMGWMSSELTKYMVETLHSLNIWSSFSFRNLALHLTFGWSS